jgi:hypothetical protein
MDLWKNARHWKTDDLFVLYLSETLHLNNADAIVQKLVSNPEAHGIIEFAKGSKRLRYERGIFYLDDRDEVDMGMGTNMNGEAIRQRLQALAGRAKVTVVLDKHLHCASSSREWCTSEADGFDIKLNPLKIKTPAKLREIMRDLEKEVAG